MEGVQRVSGEVSVSSADPIEVPSRFGYRPELDGLRTIAVYLVVAYHAGLSWFSNGYLGVDVFFVLSGFLVTNILINELNEHGRIRFGRFYARRIRRLLPAASATIIGTLIVLRFVATSADRAPIGTDARAASLWFANFNALDRVESGIADPSPLLHFWSLSIEEQFYVFFPIALLGLWLAGSRRLNWTWRGLAALAVVFAFAQVVINRSNWDAAYYSTPARIYQMLAGAALAAVLRSRAKWIPRLPSVIPSIALAMVVTLSLGVVGFIGASMRGAAVTGLVAVALLGLMQTPSRTTTALSHPVMVYLGGISYAIYLFHVPVGVLTEYAIGPMNPWWKLGYTAVVSTLMAAASAKYLEAPIRRNATLDQRHRLVVGCGLLSALTLGLIFVPILI